MRTKIFYFSGTGNTYALAKEIARKIEATDIISISKVVNEKIYIDTERIGIVFPSYLAPLSGVPLIVERFVKKLIRLKNCRFLRFVIAEDMKA